MLDKNGCIGFETGSTAIDESQAIRKMSAVSIVGNTVLSLFKLAAGLIGNSGAMVSDAVHSFSDVGTTLVALIGTKISRREADASHPYGHDRIESLASLALGVVLFLVGIGIGSSGVESIISENYKHFTAPTEIALVAAAISILVKEAMFWYTRHYARAIGSSVFMADAWHHRSDALSSIGALVGIGGAMAGYAIMDPLASIVICCFIIKVSFDIAKDACSRLLDASCGEEYENEMAENVLAVKGVESVDMIRSRRFGSGSCIDLEVSVDEDLTLRKAHEISERARAAVLEKDPNARHVTVHANPKTTRSVR